MARTVVGCLAPAHPGHVLPVALGAAGRQRRDTKERRGRSSPDRAPEVDLLTVERRILFSELTELAEPRTEHGRIHGKPSPNELFHWDRGVGHGVLEQALRSLTRRYCDGEVGGARRPATDHCREFASVTGLGERVPHVAVHVVFALLCLCLCLCCCCGVVV